MAPSSSAPGSIGPIVLVGTGRRPIPPTGYGGIERTVGELAEALRALGQTVEVLNTAGRAGFTTGWTFERHLPRLLAERRGTVVHAHTGRAALVLGLAGIPYVFTTHTPTWLRRTNALQAALFQREKEAVRLARATIALTPELASALGRVRLRRGPVRTIPLGVDPEKFAPRGPGDARIALGVGVIEPRKRWEIAAEALQNTGVRLRLVGPVHDRELARRLTELGAEVLGEVDEPTLLQRYAECGFVVHPSEFEIFPGAVLQAMASGRPVLGGPAIAGIEGTISAESGDLPRLVRFLRTWAERFLGDDRQRRELGQAARAKVIERYAWGRIAERHLDLYRASFPRTR